MKKIDQFILKSFLGPFVLTFLIVTFALLLQFLWLYIDELVGKGLGFGVIAEFLGWGAATLIPLALPLATLFASIMTMGGFGENSELLAMKAAGISLPRILSPLIVLSFFISIGAFFAANNLIPVAYNNIYALRDDIGKTKEEIRIPTGVFYDGIEGYNIRIDRRDKKSGNIYGVMVYNHASRSSNSLTIADSGSIKLTTDKANLIFTLHNGYSYEEPYHNMSDTAYALQRIGFNKQELIISLENYAFKRSDANRFSKEVMSQNLKQLSHARDSLDSAYVIVKGRQLQDLLASGGLTTPSQLDSSQFKQYQAEFDIDSLGKFKTLYDEQLALEGALSATLEATSVLDNYQLDEYRYSYPLRKVRVERFRKFTLSFACFIFFFIGAPLGAIIRKGGLGTPVVVSMLFFVIYWVVDISGKKLATDGVVTPAMGTLISTFVLLPMGVYLTWKSTKDSSLFNAEIYKNFFKRVVRLNFKKERYDEE